MAVDLNFVIIGGIYKLESLLRFLNFTYNSETRRFEGIHSNLLIRTLVCGFLYVYLWYSRNGVDRLSLDSTLEFMALLCYSFFFYNKTEKNNQFMRLLNLCLHHIRTVRKVTKEVEPLCYYFILCTVVKGLWAGIIVKIKTDQKDNSIIYIQSHLATQLVLLPIVLPVILQFTYLGLVLFYLNAHADRLNTLLQKALADATPRQWDCLRPNFRTEELHKVSRRLRNVLLCFQRIYKVIYAFNQIMQSGIGSILLLAYLALVLARISGKTENFIQFKECMKFYQYTVMLDFGFILSYYHKVEVGWKRSCFILQNSTEYPLKELDDQLMMLQQQINILGRKLTRHERYYSHLSKLENVVCVLAMGLRFHGVIDKDEL